MDVLQVEPDHVIEVRAASTGHLPQAGDTGLGHEHTSIVPSFELLDFVRKWWARPDERHVSAQDVQELWKLVQTGLSQHPAHKGHARIVDDFEKTAVPRGASRSARLDEFGDELAMQFVVGIDAHRPKLEHGEG